MSDHADLGVTVIRAEDGPAHLMRCVGDAAVWHWDSRETFVHLAGDETRTYVVAGDATPMQAVQIAKELRQ